MLPDQRRAFTPTRDLPVEDELVQRTRRRQQACAGLGNILPLTKLVDQFGNRAVVETIGGVPQRPSTDDRNTSLDGALQKGGARARNQDRRERRDFLEPQRQRIRAVVRGQVHAGNRQRIRQRWTTSVRAQFRDRHCPAAEDFGGQDIAKYEWRRDAPVDVEGMWNAKAVRTKKMVLPKDDAATHVMQAVVGKTVQNVRQGLEFMTCDDEVDVSVGT